MSFIANTYKQNAARGTGERDYGKSFNTN